jgi:hypothetical protein
MNAGAIRRLFQQRGMPQRGFLALDDTRPGDHRQGSARADFEIAYPDRLHSWI